MINPVLGSYGSGGGSGSRRTHYSRSDSNRPLKRSRPTNGSPDDYDRSGRGNGLAQSFSYSSIYIRNISPKLSDSEIRELCDRRFAQYRPSTIHIYHGNHERIAIVTFTNCEDARNARYTKTGLVWGNKEVVLDPMYSRPDVPMEQLMRPDSSREYLSSMRHRRRGSPRIRSPLPGLRRPVSPRSWSPPLPLPPPPPPPASVSSRHSSSSRSRRNTSSNRSSRRPYEPYIPLPPDLLDYAQTKNSLSQQRSRSSSSARHGHHKATSKQKRSRSPSDHRTPSPSASSARTNHDDESSSQLEPTRTLLIENLDRNITESKLEEVFGSYGTIHKIDLRKPNSSSKRPYAYIQYENVDMAFEARRTMNGQSIGKLDCKIGYGKVTPTKCLWVGNISEDIKRRDLEYAFSRFGQIKSFMFSNGDPTAIITYNDVEDAVKAREKLNGTITLSHGRIIHSELNASSSAWHGFRIDYLERPTSRRFVIVRPQKRISHRQQSHSSSSSRSRQRSLSTSAHDQQRSTSCDVSRTQETQEKPIENIKTEIQSRSPTPPPASPTSSPPPPESPPSAPEPETNTLCAIKQRRSTDHTDPPTLPNPIPIAGRTFYSPLGSYLSSNDTGNVNNLNELMILCEKLNASATKSNTALSTVYPVQFILKSHAYDARMHFLAGSPTLASIVLGQPGDLIAAKKELKITQRLRLDIHKLDELDRKLRNSVAQVLSQAEDGSHVDFNGHASNGLPLIGHRKHYNLANQTRFSVLIASPKIYCPDESTEPNKNPTLTKTTIKSEILSPSHINTNDNAIQVKQEKIDPTNEKEDDGDNDEDDESSLSHLISYLDEKEAAGVISESFHPTHSDDDEEPSKQETAVIHIFPPCQFTRKALEVICPSIKFTNESDDSSTHSMTTSSDEHLMVVIVNND